MDSVLRTAAVYVFLLIVFRVAGKRSLGSITTFDFVLLLIIGEATQNALLLQDASLTNAFLVILTLVGIEIGLTLLKVRSPTLEKWLDGTPLVVVEEGRVLHERLRRSRVDEDDILEAAHQQLG